MAVEWMRRLLRTDWVHTPWGLFCYLESGSKRNIDTRSKGMGIGAGSQEFWSEVVFVVFTRRSVTFRFIISSYTLYCFALLFISSLPTSSC